MSHLFYLCIIRDITEVVFLSAKKRIDQDGFIICFNEKARIGDIGDLYFGGIFFDIRRKADEG